jgi:hypothetical protein
MSDPMRLTPDDQRRLDAIRRRNTAIDALADHVHDFADTMHKLSGTRLPQWIAVVLASDLPQLHSFAKGLQRDLAAVTAGLTLPWSSGPVEGQVNRVKMLKRQMYGRAKFRTRSTDQYKRTSTPACADLAEKGRASSARRRAAAHAALRWTRRSPRCRRAVTRRRR